MEMKDDDQAVMTVVDHLGELRNRLIRSAMAVLAGSAIGFVVAPNVRTVLVQLLPTDEVRILGPGDAFGITLRIAFVTGVVLAMPIVLHELWAFVKPGLTLRERNAVRPLIALALVFFLVGVAIAWLILPYALGFLLSFTDAYVRAEGLAAAQYFDFVTTMFLAFGLLMEFPIVIVAFARVGIIDSALVSRARRYVIVAIALLATVATPGGDLVSPAILGGTMYGLFELTVWYLRRTGR